MNSFAYIIFLGYHSRGGRKDSRGGGGGGRGGGANACMIRHASTEREYYWMWRDLQSLFSHFELKVCGSLLLGSRTTASEISISSPGPKCP